MSWMLLSRVGGVMVVVGFVVTCTLLFADTRSFLNRAWRRHTDNLQRHASFLFLDYTGMQIAKTQVGVAVGAILVFTITENPLMLFVFGLALVGPTFMLEKKSTQRVEMIEKQLDPWLLLMGNALKASGAIAEAIEASSRMIPAPLGQELELCLKEMQFGSSLHKAVLNMSQRIGSRTVSAALSAILIGQKTGGDLPLILEESSAALREIGRLEGMIRAKLAEGRMQLIVMGFAPFVLLGAIFALNKTLLAPLFKDILGYMIMGAAFALWLTSILIARKILSIQA